MEKLNEKTKNYVRIGGIIIVVVFLCFAGWFLFGDITTDDRSSQRVESGFTAVETEQREVEHRKTESKLKSQKNVWQTIASLSLVYAIAE